MARPRKPLMVTDENFDRFFKAACAEIDSWPNATEGDQPLSQELQEALRAVEAKRKRSRRHRHRRPHR